MSMIEMLLLYSAILVLVVGMLLSVLPTTTKPELTREPEQEADQVPALGEYYDEATDTWTEAS
jgi:hypothetical protein